MTAVAYLISPLSPKIISFTSALVVLLVLIGGVVYKSSTYAERFECVFYARIPEYSRELVSFDINSFLKGYNLIEGQSIGVVSVDNVSRFTVMDNSYDDACSALSKLNFYLPIFSDESVDAGVVRAQAVLLAAKSFAEVGESKLDLIIRAHYIIANPEALSFQDISQTVHGERSGEEWIHSLSPQIFLYMLLLIFVSSAFPFFVFKSSP